MAEKKNAPNFKVSIDTAERLRLLSAKSGYSISYLLEQLSLLADYLPDNCDRCTLGIFPRIENRSILFIVIPIFCGVLENVPENISDKDLDARFAEAARKKIEGEE